jgi:hypothetical protein
LLLAGAPQEEQKRTLSEIPVPQAVQVGMNFLETVYRLSGRFVPWAPFWELLPTGARD